MVQRKRLFLVLYINVNLKSQPRKKQCILTYLQWRSQRAKRGHAISTERQRRETTRGVWGHALQKIFEF